MNSPQTNPETRIPETRIPETRIDHALDALRHAQPRAGLEPRILHALESGRKRAPSLFAFLRLPSLRVPARRAASLPVWAAAAALTLIALAAVLLHRPTPTPHSTALATTEPATMEPGLAGGFSPLNTNTRTNGALAPAQPILSSRPKRTAILPTRLTSDLSSRPISVLSSRPKAALFAAAAERPAGRIAPAQHLTPEEAADLADLHAPSHPAPPLPLTPQEKALLRLVRYRNTTQLAELAALNPEVSAARDAQEAAAFHAFFPDPPPLHQPGDSE
ncbi:MAG TPA: hypothetical protein VIJ65_08045 [Acidobacteriaceae bacterium]